MLGVFCRRWGVPLIDGGTVRLPRLIGLGRALDMILTGRAVAGRRGAGMGLVNRVVPAGAGAGGRGGSWPVSWPRCPRSCLRSDRPSALEGLALDEDAALANEFRHGLSALAAPGLAEEIARFTGRGGAPA